jgi:hypothetical protein
MNEENPRDIKIEIMKILSEGIYLGGYRDKVVQSLNNRGFVRPSIINGALDDLIEHGFITENPRDFYYLNYLGVKELNTTGAIDNIDILIKMMTIHSELKSYSDEIRYQLDIARDQVATLTAENEFMKQKLDIQISESDSMKYKYIEIMGVFIAIFSIIGFNLSFIDDFVKGHSIFETVSLIFIVNGSLLSAILMLLLGIKSLILNGFLSKKKIAFFYLVPLIPFVIGLVLLFVIHSKLLR